MKIVEENLFSLLRLGLKTEPPSNQAFQNIVNLTEKQWVQLKALADQQGISVIALDGLNSLCQIYGQEGVSWKCDKVWWKKFILDWTGQMMVVERKNHQQFAVMNDMADKWAEAGCRVMIMKGQANGTMYPVPEHRSPGDIDCYLFEHYARGNEIARQLDAKVDESWYKHSVISYNGETFENHQFFVHTRDGKRGKRLEKELEKALNVSTFSFLPLTSSILMPPVQWNAMFLTYHACAHFLSEGLRLKQVLDWAMFLKANQNIIDWLALNEFCERHHLRRFMDAMTTIAVYYLGIEVADPASATTSPYAERILSSALYDDDYVFGSGEGGWHNRWHLVKNLFRYRWKYEDIYETSPWKQLWYYATGFVFKTE